MEHLFRGREPPSLEAVLAHYEAIAAGLEGLCWTSRGPFMQRWRMWIELTPRPPAATVRGVRRFPSEWC